MWCYIKYFSVFVNNVVTAQCNSNLFQTVAVESLLCDDVNGLMEKTTSFKP